MGIDFTNFQQVLGWVISHGYPLMFLAMCIEGPTIIVAAAFGASLGYFNPSIVFILAVFGDIVPDSLYYWIGRSGNLSLVRNISKRFGIGEKRIANLEKHIKSHGGKTVAVLKYTPVLAMPGLMLVGAMRMNWWKYIKTVLVVNLQRTIILMILGYFFGRTYDIAKYIKYGAMAPFIIIIVYISFAWLYGFYSKRIVNKIEKL